MYHWIEDKKFLKSMRGACSNIINRLVQKINNGEVMTVEAHLVGSGAKNLETQNESEPIDLDYNLVIIDTYKYSINDGRSIKEYVRKIFNKILSENGWGDCHDSKSALTTERVHFEKGNSTEFSIDLAIVVENGNKWFRLIHKKTGYSQTDEWIWNEGPHSNRLIEKVKWLKFNKHWNEVRETYLNKKNMYLRRKDSNHPSFNCYIESVNQVYNKYNR
jgi:hypothetical protein